MKNRVADEARRRSVEANHRSRMPQSEPGSGESLQQKLETQQALGEAVRSLPEPHRRAILLHYFEGLSVARIAAIEGCEKRAIESRLRRARGALRSEMERRAPAEHWAAGLLLLADGRAAAVPWFVAGAAAVLLVALAPWWSNAVGKRAQPSSSVERGAGLGLGSGSGSGEESPQAELAAASVTPPPTDDAADLTRSEARTSVGTEVVLRIVDEVSGAALHPVAVEIEAFDEMERILESSSGFANEDGVYTHEFGVLVRDCAVKLTPPLDTQDCRWICFASRAVSMRNTLSASCRCKGA